MPWQNNGGGGDNPWGSGGRSNGPRRPGGGSGGGGPQGPNLDDLIRQGQEKLRGSLPGGFGGANGILRLALLLIFVWVAATGFYNVRAGYVGVVTTFGERVGEPRGEGFNFKLPYPIQAVEQVSIAQIYETKIGVSGAAARRSGGLDNTLMLTGDENIVDIKFSVLWRVSDAPNFLFNIERPQEETVKVVAESALREIISRTPIQSALTSGKGQIQIETRDLIQQTLDDYQAGIEIQEVQLLDVDPPERVISAFRDVQAAEADRERVQNEAQAYANKVIPEARGQAEQMLQQARAYQERVVALAQGDAARFLSVYEEYKKAKDVTRKRIYLETMEEILAGTEKIILDENAGGGVVPYLSLSELGKRTQARGAGGQ